MIRFEKNLAIWLALLAALIQLVAISHFPWPLGSNDKSRWDTVWALTHGHGYILDQAPYGGVDRVMREGQLYSSKPPLLPTIAAIIVTLIRQFTGWQLPVDQSYILPSVLLLINIIPHGLLLVFYDRFLLRRNVGGNIRRLCLTIVAFGTYLFPYCVTLNNHTVAAVGCFVTIYCLVRILYDGVLLRRYFFTAGLAAAWTAANELPAAVFALCVSLWIFRRHPLNTLKWFLPGAVLVLLAFFSTLFLATDSLLPYYLQGGLYRYEGSYWNNPIGINAASDSLWFYAFNILLGHHGFFSLTPVLLLALVGLSRPSELRSLALLGVGLGGLMLVFLIIETNNYGGGCHGLRWAFWLIPIYLFGLHSGISLLWGSKMNRCLILIALSVSLSSSFLAMLGDRGPWGTSWIHWGMRYSQMVRY